MKARIAATSCVTLSKDPRRIAWRVMICEEHLDEVHPGPGGRGEVQRDPGVFGEPAVDVVVLVGVVVVEHDV